MGPTITPRAGKISWTGFLDLMRKGKRAEGSGKQKAKGKKAE
jgi:hypothetical protein